LSILVDFVPINGTFFAWSPMLSHLWSAKAELSLSTAFYIVYLAAGPAKSWSSLEADRDQGATPNKKTTRIFFFKK
jgi:peptidoglycan/LPS O-acetylase OafA/YrhL